MKSALGKLRDASPAERRAIVAAAALLLAVRAVLWLLPLETVLRFAGRTPAGRSRRKDEARLERMVRAIDVMGHRLFPANPCLTQAVLVQALYRRAGRPAELRIGVKREGRSRLEAHAWVEHEGTILIGATEAAHGYVPLPPFRLGA
jgi:hypothetical protein